MFNVTNHLEVQRGALPIVQEIGPYIYKYIHIFYHIFGSFLLLLIIDGCRQFRVKTIKGFSSDRSKVLYTQQQTFRFDHEASAPYTEDDRIVVLNVAMNVSLNEYRVRQSINSNEKYQVLKMLKPVS